MNTLRRWGWMVAALGACACTVAAADGTATSSAPAAAGAPAAAKAAPAAAPAAPAKAGPVRAIESDAIGADKTKGYLVYSHPLLPSESARWIAFGRRVEYTAKKGASEVHGSRYDIVFRTVFDRTGQMVFELEPGRYEVALYDSPEPGRQLSKAIRLDLAAGDVRTTSVRRMPPRPAVRTGAAEEK